MLRSVVILSFASLVNFVSGASQDLLSVFVPKTVPPPPPLQQITLSEYDKWLSFQHGPENPQTPFARFQITSTSPSLLLMTSYGLPGASFSFQLDGTPLHSMTMPRGKKGVNDPQEAFEKGGFSQTTLVLDIGPHYLDVSVAASPFANGLLAVKLVHLQIDPKYHADYFLVGTPIPVELANRVCHAFSSHLAHLPSKQELLQIVKLFSPPISVFYTGGYEERAYDGSALVLVAKGKKIRISRDIWNFSRAPVLCHRRYPPLLK